MRERSESSSGFEPRRSRHFSRLIIKHLRVHPPGVNGFPNNSLTRPSKKYPEHFLFVLNYHEDGKRHRPSFGTLKEARKAAEDAAERSTARRSCSPAPHGVPLNVAVTEFAQALAILNGGGSVVEASRHFAAVRGGEIKPISVRGLVDDLIQTRQANPASKRHLDDLRVRLERFARSFACDIHLVRPHWV